MPETAPFRSSLYPMLSEQPTAGEKLLAELALAPIEKSRESNRLRELALAEYEDELLICGRAMADRFARGATLLAIGNGGSATGAADFAVEFVSPAPPHRPLPALSLTNDVAVVTAIANDVSFDDIFLRQIIALGRRGDIVLAVSTSGNSTNIMRALAAARDRDMLTIGLSGDNGGRMAREGALDHCFTVRASSIHRIQEVQTTIAHALWELVHQQLEN
ncbi:MAG: SIS domain-containing protein [Candidatus Dormibacteria bacterium]